MKMYHKMPGVITILATALLLAVLGSALTILYTPLEYRVNEADLILVVKALNSSCQWDNEGKTISTYTEVEVEQVIKGDLASKTYTIKTPGGTVGETTMELISGPKLEHGNEYVVLLFSPERCQGSNSESNLVSWNLGMFKIENGMVQDEGTAKSLEAFLSEITAYVNAAQE